MWLWSVAAVAAACDSVAFEYSGQPECVRLVVESLEVVRLTNECAGPVLVDQRALPLRPAGAVVPAGESVALAGIAAFTLGAEGALHLVTAAPICAEPAPERRD